MEVEDIIQEVKQEIESFRKANPDGVVIIRWATATGKSKLSVLLSQFFDMEIISADSRQIFKYMDIGTDKVSKEILKKIPHHQINIVTPDQWYTAGQWQADVNEIIPQILKKKKLPVIVGGTWLYIDSIYKNFSMPEVAPDYALREKLYALEEKTPWYLHQELMKLDLEEANKLHPKSIRYLVRALEICYTSGATKTDSFFQQPPKWPILLLGLWREKEETNRRINIRIKEMIAGGLIEEVQWLLDKWYDAKLQSLQGIGYKETVEYLQWEIDMHKLEENMKKATHHLAKKQRTRFRRYIIDEKTGPKERVTYKVWYL